MQNALGVSYTASLRIARQLDARRSTAKRSGKFVVDAAAVERMVETLSSRGGLITTKQAASMLGVSEETMRNVVSAGLVSEIPPEGRAFMYQSIPRADVEAILAAFERSAIGAPLVDEPAPLHLRSGRGGTRDGFGSRAIVRGVLDGTLVPVAVWTGGRGIGRYLFDRLVAKDRPPET